MESCNGHWMPTEVSLDKDYAELNAKKLVGEKEVYQIPSNQRKVICGLLVNHIYLRQAAPNIVWLNLYRMLENPEGRQYLLRQITSLVSISLTAFAAAATLGFSSSSRSSHESNELVILNFLYWVS